MSEENKPGKVGRPLGLKNKKSKEWEALRDLLVSDTGLDKFREELNKLRGKHYVNAYLKALEFILPKLARVEMTGDEEKPLEQRITFVVKDQTGNKIKEMGGDKPEEAIIIN